jgi:uncharacterized membrane protein YccC
MTPCLNDRVEINWYLIEVKAPMASERVTWTSKMDVTHSLRTAVAAILSLLAAKLLRTEQYYWAPVTTLVITQSSLGAALSISTQRFIGTVLGAALAAIVATYFGSNMLVFSLAVFALGLLCSVLGSGRSAYRFAGVALTIVLLIPRTQPAWRIAFYRSAEVSVGIVVALILAWVWPEREVTQAQKT